MVTIRVSNFHQKKTFDKFASRSHLRKVKFPLVFIVRASIIMQRPSTFIVLAIVKIILQISCNTKVTVTASSDEIFLQRNIKTIICLSIINLYHCLSTPAYSCIQVSYWGLSKFPAET